MGYGIWENDGEDRNYGRDGELLGALAWDGYHSIMGKIAGHRCSYIHLINAIWVFKTQHRRTCI